jgi:hypothetical protein
MVTSLFVRAVAYEPPREFVAVSLLRWGEAVNGGRVGGA